MATSIARWRGAWLAVGVAAALPACKKEIRDPDTGVVDFAHPRSVLGAVFYAARHDDPAPLASLCDPAGASEPSVTRICGLARGTPEWESFRAAFARGRSNGEPRVHDDHAELHFVFGPRGTDRETMELVRRGGRWHLLRF